MYTLFFACLFTLLMLTATGCRRPLLSPNLQKPSLVINLLKVLTFHLTHGRHQPAEGSHLPCLPKAHTYAEDPRLHTSSTTPHLSHLNPILDVNMTVMLKCIWYFRVISGDTSCTMSLVYPLLSRLTLCRYCASIFVLTVYGYLVFVPNYLIQLSLIFLYGYQ